MSKPQRCPCRDACICLTTAREFGRLEENGCGFTLTPGDGEALTEHILALAGDRDTSAIDVLFGRRIPTLSQPRPAACELANKMPHVDVGVP